ncbi:hypothetical protein [Streptomyces griseiscabiei]|uniref:Rho-GAP domain-containing protein n=1 Tax=Streptomyces griseiscabiei TaxID=2993540 RepID=A0ABU4KXP9_9ACTN|nr:hypothetical protein [Streptomyces griseiscabiei]MBZ3904419.1 hypothetical protein [Streptomyces griseiscabiei]MDX2908166.1 hypothetical protein [Streptomyces griseiscabiei]
MPAPTMDDLRTATETLSRLTEYLRDAPDPSVALALVEPLLDEYTGIPVQFGDTLRALARAVQEHPDTPRTAGLRRLVDELRTAAWEQSDQHTLHYTLDDLRTLLKNTSPAIPEGSRCR